MVAQCCRSAYFVQHSPPLVSDIDSSADWNALERFRDHIKKTLTKKYDKLRQGNKHATPLATPRTSTSGILQQSPFTSTLTPIAPSTVQSMRQRVPQTIDEHDENMDMDNQKHAAQSNKKRGRHLELDSESGVEDNPQRSSANKPKSKKGKLHTRSVEEEEDENEHSE